VPGDVEVGACTEVAAPLEGGNCAPAFSRTASIGEDKKRPKLKDPGMRVSILSPSHAKSQLQTMLGVLNSSTATVPTISAATMASLTNAAALYTRMSGTATGKLFLGGMTIDSSGGVLDVSFVASNTQFTSLVNSNLFQSVVK
jgi:hypothetical protein